MQFRPDVLMKNSPKPTMNWLNSLLRKPPPAEPAPAAARGAVRRAAAPLAPPADPAVLRAALAAAPDDGERERQEAVLGRALGALGQAPLADDSPGVWVAAICHGADRMQALAWLEQVGGDDRLARIAGSARFAEVRLAAAQRVDDGATLETIARASKNRDKGVYRHCTDLLRARREARDRARQAVAIAQALRHLLEQAPLSVSHLLETERAWNVLAGAAVAAGDAGMQAQAAASEPLRQCRDLLAQANARVLAEAGAQRALHAVAAAHDELAAQLNATQWPDTETLARWQYAHQAVASDLAALPAWLGLGGTAQALAAGLSALAARLEAWRLDHERLAHAERFLATIAPGLVPDEAIRAAWNDLPQPENGPLRESLQARWLALNAVPAPAPPPPARPPAPEPSAPAPGPALAAADLDTLRTQLEQLEQALEGGQLAQADAAARLVKATQGSHGLEPRLDARLQRALARLGDLRGWAQWGATKKREDLIDAAQQLRAGVAAGTHDVEHLSVAIPALREEWKRLNAQGPAGKGQWESFDRALEAAYVPVAAFHAQEAERRKQARAMREELLVQWETALGAIDWDHPDRGATDAQREAMFAQWRAAPHAGFRDERQLRTRFDALVRGLDERLDAVRAAEIGRRESLIAAVTALADLPDPRQASAQAKVLQERWRAEAGPLRLRRGEEQKLWQRFRAGCDVVFARRDAERTVLSAQRQERAQARAALIASLAALVDAPVAAEGAAGADERPAEVAELQRALVQFRADWAASTTLAGESDAATSGQERQAREMQQKAQARIAAARAAAVAARYAALARSAATAEGLDPASREKGRNEREEILIDLEISLGLATPGAGAQIRRRRQLEQLQNRFRAGPAPAARDHDPDKLLARWYATAADHDDDHAQRVAAVVGVLVERQRLALARAEAPPTPRVPAGARSRPRPDDARGRPTGKPAQRERR